VGVALVSGTLSVLGWLIAIAGFFVAIRAATQKGEFLGTEIIELSTAERLGIFFGTLILFWLFAVIVLWSAYVLRLLSDIERRLAGSSPSSRVGR